MGKKRKEPKQYNVEELIRIFRLLTYTPNEDGHTGTISEVLNTPDGNFIINTASISNQHGFVKRFNMNMLIDIDTGVVSFSEAKEIVPKKHYCVNYDALEEDNVDPKTVREFNVLYRKIKDTMDRYGIATKVINNLMQELIYNGPAKKLYGKNCGINITNASL